MSNAAKKINTNETAMGEENITFAAEISKVLKLMIHSLYTNKDIFLRELISNASDACDKLRYESQKDAGLMGDHSELQIELSYNAKKKTLTISDNGIGMNREDLINNLGTIAKSGTQEFAEALSGDKEQDLSLIGQFGVGFYSAFMVADRVEVITQKAGTDEGWRWASEGEGSFTIAPAEDAARGTSITLHLKKEAKEYADQYRLRHIVETYSDHIDFPIMLHATDATDPENKPMSEVINKASALWARPKSEITDEQYQEFYRHVAHQPDEPWMRLHNKLEGKIDYSYLLYIPSMKPFDLFHPERKTRVKLYVKRVFITDENADIIPEYLRFLRGVVDSEDLPLNISRETLQDNPVLAKIRDSVTKKVLTELARKGKKDEAAYAEFWENFGGVLKEGLCEAMAPREKILPCCRFASTHGDALVSLEDYKSRMKEGQEAIYFLAGDNLDTLRNSPQLEGFKKQGVEVLLFTDHVDDFWPQSTRDFESTPFRSVIKHGADLDALGGEAQDDEAKQKQADEKAESDKSIEPLMNAMKDTLGDAVRDIRTTAKLSDSPVCLAVEEGDMDLRMERFLVEHKQLPTTTRKILEINPDHAIIKGLNNKLITSTDDSATLDEPSKEIVRLLLDQAKIAEGETVDDPSAFARRMSALIAGGLA